MLGRRPRARLVWFFIGAMTLALLAVACGDDEEAKAAPDTAAIQAAVAAALQQALPTAAPAPVSASELQKMVKGAISDIPAVQIPDQVSAQELQAMVEAAVSASAAAAAKPLTASEIASLVEAAVTASTGDAATKSEIEAVIAKATQDAAEAAARAATRAALLAVPTQVVRAAPVSGAAGQKYGGTVKIGVVDFGTMDPALMGLSEGSNLYSELTYDNATVLWYDGALTPWAIESWTTNPDLTTYTFNVRQGIKFHHGKDLQAEDVKFTFDRLLDESTASPIRGALSHIDNITVVDDYTVAFNLAGPNVFLPNQLTDYHARILPSDVDIGLITSREFGSGAFTLEDHNPAERTVMKANPDYWRSGVPYVDEIILFYMPEQTTRIEALKSGAIDVVLDTLTFSVLDDLEANPNVIVKEAPTAGVRVLDFHTDRAPFNNKNLRKAFQYAVDRDFVREASLFGRGSNANDHPVGRNDEYYWDDQPIVMQDIPRAIAYLEAAGYSDGFDVELTTSDFGSKLEVALAFKESVAEAGIRVTINNADTTTYWEEFWMNPCCPFVASSWGARPAPSALADQFTGVWNESYYDNDRLDVLLGLASAEGDFATRKEYYREIQEILIEDVPVLYLMYIPEILAHRTRMQGVRVNPNLAIYLMEEWWIE